MSVNPLPSLGVSIVAYNTPNDELAQCLSRLNALCVKRITVVDNSRNSLTKQLCDGMGNVCYVESENVGYGAGHNKAILRSIDDGIDFHLVLNSDVSFNGDDLNLMVGYMAEHPDVVLLQPKILSLNGQMQYTARLLPTPLDLILRRFLPKWIMRKRRRRYELQHVDHSKIFEAPYFQGSFMLMRTDALRECGGFDERFFMYPEDIDLSRRLHGIGRTIYHPGFTIVHAHRAASYKSAKMLWIHCKNMIRYFNKWGWVFDSSRKNINKTL